MSGGSWAEPLIRQLLAGEAVKFRPRGDSMTPRIKSGQLVTVEPVEPKNVAVGDVVLCKVGNFFYLHLVDAVRPIGDRLFFTIKNNRGHVNGQTWKVYGRLTAVES